MQSRKIAFLGVVWVVWVVSESLRVLYLTSLRLHGLGFRVQGSGFRVQGLGFRV